MFFVGCGDPSEDGEGPATDSTSTTDPTQSDGTQPIPPADSSTGSTTNDADSEDTGSSTTGTNSGTGIGPATDSGTDTDSEPPPRLPAVEWCDPAASPVWQTTTGGGSDAGAYVAYACTQACRSIDGCTFADGGFTSGYFVVDQMGGALRWQTGSDMLFMHNGGTGTSYPAGELVDQVLSGGHGIAMARWEAGSSVDGANMGWATRPDEAATDFVRLTARIASVIDWVERELAEGTYGTAACSAGSYVTFAAQVWHDLGERLDYQLFVGGPPFANLARGCGSDPKPAGRCSNDPTATCSDDNDCGAGPLAICSTYLNNEQGPLAEMVDSAHRSEPDCDEANANEAWEASDLLAPSGNFTLSHPVDFVMNMGPGLGDPRIGAFANAWDVAQSLSGDEVGWHQFPGAHCDAFSGSAAWPMLEAGMGW